VSRPVPAHDPSLDGVVCLAVLDRRPDKERKHDNDGENRLGDDQHFNRDFHLSRVRQLLSVLRRALPLECPGTRAAIRRGRVGYGYGYVVVVVVVVVVLFTAVFATGQATPELLLITRQPFAISLPTLRLRSIPRTLLATCA